MRKLQVSEACIESLRTIWIVCMPTWEASFGAILQVEPEKVTKIGSWFVKGFEVDKEIDQLSKSEYEGSVY